MMKTVFLGDKCKLLMASALIFACFLSGCKGNDDPAESGGTSSAVAQVSSVASGVSEASSQMTSSENESTAPESTPASSASVSSASSSGPAAPRFNITSVSMKNPDISAEALKVSFVAEGNLARIARVFDKAAKGEKVVLGFLGGSITEGMCASQPINRYSSRVLEWFKTTYPSGKFELVNAGIGSTGSIIAGGRMEADLLSKKPDLIFLDFAVNDGASDLEQESYEGLVYRALSAANKPGVMLLFMTRNDGGNCQDKQIPIGLKYNLPMISYRNAVAKGIGQKLFTWADISPDIVHPSNRGHAILADLITHRLKLIKKNLSSISRTIPAMPKAETRFTSQILHNSKNYKPVSLGSFKPATGQYANDSLSKGWTAATAGSPLVFETRSKVVTLVYKRMVMTRGAKLIVKIDGVQKMVIESDGGFAEYADLKTIIDRDSAEKCKVELMIASDSVPGSSFMLLGIIE